MMAAPVGGGGGGNSCCCADDDDGTGTRPPPIPTATTMARAENDGGPSVHPPTLSSATSPSFDVVKPVEGTRPRHPPLRILTVGDGDLSFSLALLRCYNGDVLREREDAERDDPVDDGDDGSGHQPPSSSTSSPSSPPQVHVTTTTFLPSESALRGLYPSTAPRILDELRRCHRDNSRILFGVDATMLHENPTLVEKSNRLAGGDVGDGDGSFDCVMFNHPHLGYDDMGDESAHASRHRALLSHYLHSASELLRLQHRRHISASEKDDDGLLRRGRRRRPPVVPGTIHVTLCGSQPRTWGLSDAARRNGLVEIYSGRVERPISNALLAGRRRTGRRGTSPDRESETDLDGMGDELDQKDDELVPVASPPPYWRAPRKFRNGRLGSVHFLSKYGYAHVKTRPGGGSGGGGGGPGSDGSHHRGTTTRGGRADVDLSLAVHYVFALDDADARPSAPAPPSSPPPHPELEGEGEEASMAATGPSSPAPARPPPPRRTPPFPCRVCGEGFPTAEELRRHEEAPMIGAPLTAYDGGMTSSPPSPAPAPGEDVDGGDVSHPRDGDDAALTATASVSAAATTSVVASGIGGGRYRCEVTGRTYSSMYALAKSQDHLPLRLQPEKEEEAGGEVRAAAVSVAESSTNGEGIYSTSRRVVEAVVMKGPPRDAAAAAAAAVDGGDATTTTTASDTAPHDAIVLGRVVVPPGHDGTRLRKFARMRQVDPSTPSGAAGTDPSASAIAASSSISATYGSLGRHLTSKRVCDGAIKAGRLAVNGAVALDSSRILRGGDVVELLRPPPPPPSPAPSDLTRIGEGATAGTSGDGGNRRGGGNPHVKVHYEDEDVIVAWKPVGVRPCGDFPGTLQSCLQTLLASASFTTDDRSPDGGGRRRRFHPISRLETGCGGLCLVAKSDAVRDGISSRLLDDVSDHHLELSHVFVALVHGVPPDGWGQRGTTKAAELSIPAGEDDAAGSPSFWNKRRKKKVTTTAGGSGRDGDEVKCGGGVAGGGDGGIEGGVANAASQIDASFVQGCGGEGTAASATTTAKHTAWHSEPVEISVELIETSRLPPRATRGIDVVDEDHVGRVPVGRGQGAFVGGGGALSTVRLTVVGRRGRVCGALCHALRSAGNPVVGDRFCRDELASLPRSCRNVLKSKLWIGCYGIRCRVGTATVTAYHSPGGGGTSSSAASPGGCDYDGIEIRVPYPDRMLASYWTKLAGGKQVGVDTFAVVRKDSPFDPSCGHVSDKSTNMGMPLPPTKKEQLHILSEAVT